MVYEIQKLVTHGPGEYYEHMCYFESDKELSEFKKLMNYQYKYGEYKVKLINVVSEHSTLVNSILDSGEKE